MKIWRESGAITFGSEMVTHRGNIKKVNWKDVAVDALTGAATGALVGSGAGIVAVTVGNGIAGGANYAVKTTLNNEWSRKDGVEHVQDIAFNISINTVLGYLGGTSQKEIAAYRSLKKIATWDSFLSSLAKDGTWRLTAIFINLYLI